MLLDQKVMIQWNQKNRKWFEERDYPFTEYKDDFEVDVKDLYNGIEVFIKIQCDYCGKIIDRRYDYYVSNQKKNIVGKDACADCIFIKRNETTFLKYGVTNINQLQETKDKKIETCRKNFGVDHPGQSKEITEKMKQSRIESLGTPWAMQNFSVRVKTKQSLFEHGTAACSKQQKYLCNLLGGQLNYPIENCAADILLNNNIIIEYNGGGHDKNVHAGVITRSEFENKERKRDYFLKSQGYKIIKIITPRDYLPKKDEKIIELIDNAIGYMTRNNTNHFNIEFSDKMNDPVYGKLRKITKKILEEQEANMASFLLSENEIKEVI